MTTFNIDMKITEAREAMESMSKEIFRMQGVIKAYQKLKDGGLKTIDLPKDPDDVIFEEPASTQEKPE
jgi:hypothetical protein